MESSRIEELSKAIDTLEILLTTIYVLPRHADELEALRKERGASSLRMRREQPEA